MALRSILSKLLGPSAGSAETQPPSDVQVDSVASAVAQVWAGEAVPAAAVPAEPVTEPQPKPIPELEPDPELEQLLPPDAPHAAGDNDAVQPGDASSWIYDPVLFGEPMPVAAFLGSQRLMTAADYRADLDGGSETLPPASADAGYHAHGFRLDFSQATMPELPTPVAEAAGDPQRPKARERSKDSEAPAPVFIIGNAPAAADRLASSLIQSAGMAGAVQGRLLPLAYQLIRTTTQFYRGGLATAGADAMIRQVEAAIFQRAIRRMFADALAERFPGADWVDNTPGLLAIQSVMTMRAIWPRARFVFIGSRMMESVVSRGTGEPLRPMKERVTAWAREMQAWLDVRERLGKTCVTIDQIDLTATPAVAAADIASLLALDDLTTARLTAALSGSAGSAPPPLSITDLPGFDRDEADAIRGIAQPMMDAFGYGWERYFGEGKRLLF